MSSKKIITVLGATGNQGGSVIAAILAQPSIASQYRIRGVTRDTAKLSAEKLKSDGVDLIKADLNDLSSLKAAFKDAFAVFAVTNYWETMSKSTEVAQGKNIVDAAIASRVKHLIFSSLPNVTTLTEGILPNVEHFDSKAEVSEYAEVQKSKTGMWVTHFMPGYFMQNLKNSISKDPQTNASIMAAPWDETSTKIPLIDIVSDAGKYVAGALVLGSAADGARIQAVSQWVTPTDVASTISEITGTKVTFVEVPKDVWEGYLPLPPHAKTELGENMILIKDYNYYGKDSPAKQHGHNVYIEAVPGQQLTTLADFVKNRF
ncbi:hypothetical protein C7974DRAFT_381698 [Boeremia exigua]|uniref:uncharacterized protein n=1 Tax=Boeremia exigua TaxID=749465 RepID=UPI001E8E9B83|nr:uncharacterized protein C7974DRAFT_381698 [Boeremia exigua]KAH6643513.1 hypothetical protein C7974DRAFT_381698 [Boeremia exigua]